MNFYRIPPLTIVEAKPIVVFHNMWDGSIYMVELGLNDGTRRRSIFQGNEEDTHRVCAELTSLLPLPYHTNLGPVPVGVWNMSGSGSNANTLYFWNPGL